MIYVKSIHEGEMPVTVVGGNPEANEIYVILSNGEFHAWDINEFTSDNDFLEIAKSAIATQQKYTNLWNWWKESAENSKAKNPDSIFHKLDNEKIERNCNGIFYLCWEKAKAELEGLYEERKNVV